MNLYDDELDENYEEYVQKATAPQFGGMISADEQPGSIVAPRGLQAQEIPQNPDTIVDEPGLNAPDSLNPQKTPEEDRLTKIRSFLEKNYADSQAPSAEAKQKDSRMQKLGQVGHGLEQILKSNSVAHGGPQVDGDFYKNLGQGGQSDRNEAVANEKQAKADMIKQYLMDQKQMGDQKLMGIKPQANSPTARDSGINSRHDDRMGVTRQKMLLDTHDKMQNPRGNRAIQRAMLGAQSGEYILTLFEQYPDLDKMPALDVSLVSEEIAALVGGGKGSDKSRDAVTAKTFQSQWNEFLGKVNNNPTPSQLGAFLKQKKKYVEELTKINERQVRDYQKATFDRLKNINPSDQELGRFKETFPDLFQEEGANGPMVELQPQGEGVKPLPKVGEEKVLPDNTKFRFDGKEWVEI